MKKNKNKVVLALAISLLIASCTSNVTSGSNSTSNSISNGSTSGNNQNSSSITPSTKINKELIAKKEANAKAYKTKLQAVDKSISDTINAQAKAMGYDMVLTKGVVLYGGDDITEAVSKVVK